MMTDIAVFGHDTCAVADQKLCDAFDGIDQNRTGALSEAGLSRFETLMLRQGAHAKEATYEPTAESSVLHEINGSGSLGVDRWATLVALVELRELSR